MWVRRWSLLAVVSLFVTGVWYAHLGLRIAVAHAAKTWCSGVFVSGRAESEVTEELGELGIPFFRLIEHRVDTATGEVVAAALGIVKRRAAFRDRVGCALDAEASRRVDPWGRSGRPVKEMQATTDTLVAGGTDLQRVLSEAFEEPSAARPRRTLAVVVWRDGRVVGERYAEGVSIGTALPGWSMAKSVMHALVGILAGQGRLDVHAPLAIDAWSAPGDPRQAITIEHLLQMRSGLDFDESSSLRSDVLRMLLLERDVGAFAASRPLAAPPGVRWSYASGSTNLISWAMKNAFASESAYQAFPRQALFDPLGMSSAVMETDAAGTLIGSSYLYASARDWARFGALYLNDGWHDGRRLLPEGWVRHATAPSPADPTRSYGAHFWLRITPDYAPSGTPLPADAYHAVGHEGQFVSVVPSSRIVVVRLGRTRASKSWDQARFVRDVIAAVRNDQPPP